MRLTDDEWHAWAEDGLTVRSFRATIEGSGIHLWSGESRILQVEVPNEKDPWTESEVTPFEGSSFVLVAKRLDGRRVGAELFENGISLLTGRTLDASRATGVIKRQYGPRLSSRMVVRLAPLFTVLVLVRPMFNEVTSATLPFDLLTVALSFGASLVASYEGSRMLDEIHNSGKATRVRSALVALGVLLFGWLVALLLIVGPFAPWLRRP
jgi:hypothetical protein